jgi:hypothetical protein
VAGAAAGGEAAVRDHIAGALLVLVLIVIPLLGCLFLAMAR